REQETGVSLATPEKKIRTLQRTLYVKAKQEPTRRFHALYDKVWRDDLLAYAYACCRANGGAPGVDGETFARIEADGVDRWLSTVREEVRSERYNPRPVKRVMIPKPRGTGQRPLGIPTIRDRVVQTAAVLVLEPIFEADFDEAAYGYRPHRSALDAVRRVHQAIDEGHTEIVDADVSKYFDTIPHSELMTCIARRISDGKMLRLIRMWLKAPVEETDAGGHRRMSGGQKATRGTPQGGVATPRTQKVTSSLNVRSLGGVSSQCLICVVSSTMFMSRGASDEGPQSPPDERRLSPSRSADRGCGRGTAARTRVSVVATPGLPLPRTGCPTGRSCDRRRTDGGYHLQTAGEPGPCASRVRPTQRPHTRANRHTGANGISWRLPATTWVSGARATVPCAFSSITPSIGCEPPSSPRHKSFWSRRMHTDWHARG